MVGTSAGESLADVAPSPAVEVEAAAAMLILRDVRAKVRESIVAGECWPVASQIGEISLAALPAKAGVLVRDDCRAEAKRTFALTRGEAIRSPTDRVGENCHG